MVLECQVFSVGSGKLVPTVNKGSLLEFGASYNFSGKCQVVSPKYANVLCVLLLCLASSLVTGKLVPTVEQTQSAWCLMPAASSVVSHWHYPITMQVCWVWSPHDEIQVWWMGNWCQVWNKHRVLASLLPVTNSVGSDWHCVISTPVCCV